MPVAANIVLANGEATPVNHTFAPLGQDRASGYWMFEDQSPRVATTSQLGWPKIGIRTQRATEAGPGQDARTRVNKVSYSIALPGLETLGTADSGLVPPSTVAYIDRVKGEFFLSARDSLADRKDLVAYNKNLMSNAILTDVVQNLTAIYG